LAGIRVDLLAIPFHLLFKVRRGTSNATAHWATMLYSFVLKASIAFVKRNSRARYASESMVVDVDKKLAGGVVFENLGN